METTTKTWQNWREDMRLHKEAAVKQGSALKAEDPTEKGEVTAPSCHDAENRSNINLPSNPTSNTTQTKDGTHGLCTVTNPNGVGEGNYPTAIDGDAKDKAYTTPATPLGKIAANLKASSDFAIPGNIAGDSDIMNKLAYVGGLVTADERGRQLVDDLVTKQAGRNDAQAILNEVAAIMNKEAQANNMINQVNNMYNPLVKAAAPADIMSAINNAGRSAADYQRAIHNQWLASGKGEGTALTGEGLPAAEFNTPAQTAAMNAQLAGAAAAKRELGNRALALGLTGANGDAVVSEYLTPGELAASSTGTLNNEGVNLNKDITSSAPNAGAGKGLTLGGDPGIGNGLFGNGSTVLDDNTTLTNEGKDVFKMSMWDKLVEFLKKYKDQIGGNIDRAGGIGNYMLGNSQSLGGLPRWLIAALGAGGLGALGYGAHSLLAGDEEDEKKKKVKSAAFQKAASACVLSHKTWMDSFEYPFEKLAYMQGAVDGEAMANGAEDPAAQAAMGGEAIPADDTQFSDEEILQAIQALYESGQVSEDQVAALMQQLQGDQIPAYTAADLAMMLQSDVQSGQLDPAVADQIANEISAMVQAGQMPAGQLPAEDPAAAQGMEVQASVNRTAALFNSML